MSVNPKQDTAELIAKLGRDNGFLLLRVVQTFGALRELLLEYSDYADAFSDAVTCALNRRVVTNDIFRKGGTYASVLYTADKENKLCSMEFEGECNGRFYLHYAIGEREEDEEFIVALEEGTSLEFIHSMLDALWASHTNLYEQLTAVKEGYGYLTVEPKTPN